MRPSVVISGMGMISAAGANLAEARAKLISGTCCLSPITDPRAARLRARYAGQLTGFEIAGLPPELKPHDRYVRMAWIAAREALKAAGVEPAELGRRMGLIFSTCSGPMLLIEAHYERIIRGNPALTEAGLFARRYYSGAQVLARTLGVRGPCTTIVTACSASTAAIGVATDLIRCGMLDAALAGGADSFAISTLAGFDGLKATSDAQCAPFSKPSGLNLGEAAAFVFLESGEAARRRGARVRAEVLGSGMSNDAHHCSAPEPGGRGLAAAMKRALQDAGLSPEQISYVNAHGTGTEANDKAECKALRKVFGERAGAIPVSSTKSMVGHCLGAAGAVEVVASIACAEAGVLPSTANFSGPREGCAVDCVPRAGRAWIGPRVFLSNNSAFGGHNASGVFVVPAGSPDGRADLPVGRDARQRVRTDDSRERIFITGCGVVSAAGIGSAALAEAHRGGASGVRPFFIPGLPPLLAGRVDEAALESFGRRLNLRQMDRSSRFATVAARLAIREAKFPENPSALAELGLFLNLSAGPSWAESEFLTSFLANNHQVTELAAFPYIVPGSVAGNVCRALMLSGHNLTLCPGPGGGLLGLEPAIAALRCGHVGAILCGAVDELSDRILADQFAAGLLSEKDATPPGEGAVVLMLETAGQVQARNARPLAEICAIASGLEDHSTSTDGCECLETTVRDALAEANLEPAELGTFCACGPAMKLQRLTALWADRAVHSAGLTGVLEGAQPLLDLALTLQIPRRPKQGAFILLAAVSSRGLEGCAVIRDIDNSG